MNEESLNNPVNEMKDKLVDDQLHFLKIPFQEEVFKVLGMSKGVDNTNEEVEKLMKYSDIIRIFIFNHKNIAIRDLIVRKEFIEASRIMIDEIHNQESQQRAA